MGQSLIIKKFVKSCRIKATKPILNAKKQKENKNKFSRKNRRKKNSFFAYTKLQVDQTNEKWSRNLISHCSFKNQPFLNVKTTIILRVKKIGK